MTFVLIAFVVVLTIIAIRSHLNQQKREEEFNMRMARARAESDRKMFEQSLARTRSNPRPSVLRSVPPTAPSRSDDSTPPAPQPDNTLTNLALGAALMSTYDSTPSPSHDSSPSYDNSSSDCGSSSSYDSGSSNSDCGGSSGGSDF
jgi:uncharacterized membrane protein YgcG